MKKPNRRLLAWRKRQILAQLHKYRLRSQFRPIYARNRARRFGVRVQLAGDLDLIRNQAHCRAELAKLHREIEDLLQADQKQRVLGLSLLEVERFDPCALLYLAALINLGVRQGVEVYGTHPRSRTARALLREAGFDDYFRLSFSTPPPPSGDTLRISNGPATDQLNPKRWNELHEFMRAHVADEEALETLYAALSECIENVRQHAFGDGHQGDWFAIALRQQDDTPARAVVVDLGMGIAESVRKTMTDWIVRTVKQGTEAFLSPLIGQIDTDSELVLLATRGQRTETAEQKRGTGLCGLVESVSKNGNVRLHILSGKAMLTWKTSSPIQATVERLPGTVVCLEMGSE